MASSSRAFVLAALALASALPLPAEASHAGPIRAASDADLVPPHWIGSGTPSDPVRLAALAPTPANGYAIELANTRKHVNLSDLAVRGGGSASDGIRLVNVTNVTIWGSTLESNRVGIHAKASSSVLIAGSTIKTSATGILLEDSTGITVRDNRLALNDRDVSLKGATRNHLHSNNLSIATGQVGLSFEDNASYDNTIETTNVVNGVPVRWYTGISNTVLTGLVVDLVGITNVAQIMVHNGTAVTLERPVARSGSGLGIVVHQGAAVKVVEPIVEGNARGGLLVEASTSTRIVDASVRNNLLAGVTIRAGRDTAIESSSISGNAGAGVRATGAASAVVLRGVASAGNAAEGFHADALEDVRVEGSRFAGDPVAVTGSRAVVVRDTTIEDAGLSLSSVANALVENVTVERAPGDGIADVGSTDVRVRDSRAIGSGGHGVHATRTTRWNVTGTLVRDAGGSGIRAAEVGGLEIHDNVVEGAKDAGIALDAAGANARVAGNRIADAANGIRLARTEFAELRSNVITKAPEAIGIRFDDETSYNNVIPSTNLVDGAPIHWYVALVGTPGAPVLLPGLRSEVRGMTNVAQVMLYRSSQVEITDAVATNGTARGLYLYRSSAIAVTRADVSDNAHAGIEINATQSSTVRSVSAHRSGVAVRLVAALGNVVSGVDASGAATGVHLTSASRDNRVHAIEVAGTARGIVDEGWNGSSLLGNNVLTDAGASKRARAGEVVNFTDLSVSYRHESDRVVEQRWDWGDGTAPASSTADALFRSSHAYAAPGRFVAKLAVRLANGVELSDTTSVEIVAPLSAPRELAATIAAGTATLRWSAPESDGARAILGYAVYRGSNESDLAFVANVTTLNATIEGVDESATHVFAVAAFTAEGAGPRAIAAAALDPSPDALSGNGTDGTSTEGSADNATTEPTRPRRPTRSIPPPAEPPADTPVPAAVALGALVIAAALYRRRR